ncbi:MAG: anthranilate phosphoribosyltransferase [Candidatus Woesearchaeota archaeon]
MAHSLMIRKLIKGNPLSEGDVMEIVESISNRSFDELQLSGLLCSMESKGYTPEELFYLKKYLMKKTLSVDLGDGAIDVCGTGGDHKGTFNISTASVFVAAGAGARIAKHGNRAVSSASGSFDALKSLGIKIVNDQEKSFKCFRKTGISFLYAPYHHPVFRNIAYLRKRMGVRTVFNIIGPLLNPAGVKRQVVGVFDPALTEVVAGAMKISGVTRGMVVHGGGLDEITITGSTKVTEIKDGNLVSYRISPEDYGMRKSKISDLRAKTSDKSAALIESVLKGEISSRRDIVVLNSAAGIIVSGLAEDFGSAVNIAQDSIDSGMAMNKLEEVREAMR